MKDLGKSEKDINALVAKAFNLPAPKIPNFKELSKPKIIEFKELDDEKLDFLIAAKAQEYIEQNLKNKKNK